MGLFRSPSPLLAAAVLSSSAGLVLAAAAPAGTAPLDAAQPAPTAPAAPAAPAPSPGTGHIHMPISRTVRLEAHLKVGEEVDLGRPGRSVGDQFVFSGDLRPVGARGKQDGHASGRVGGHCVITDTALNAGQCSTTAVLREGQITVQGEQTGIPTPAPVVNAVTGGTGEFRNATGQVTQKFLTPSVWEFTFRLTLHNPEPAAHQMPKGPVDAGFGSRTAPPTR
ncbi:hypothetical protein GQS52_04860 [Streptomyces sp. SCUT-3]|uniref:hypothetical protein n=1 Tax=Streptomyces sp. SCUT-3 TaxID=2684469 RepID=UPI0015FDC760|nr:hypothetical protein [Streptomyces sp. SCUT-3]QMV21211.1 hypothetical protein GQS52_04860 [Streptomyces sp. SCUT-3]